MSVCVGTQCVPGVAACVVAKIYRPLFFSALQRLAWPLIEAFQAPVVWRGRGAQEPPHALYSPLAVGWSASPKNSSCGSDRSRSANLICTTDHTACGAVWRPHAGGHAAARCAGALRRRELRQRGACTRGGVCDIQRARCMRIAVCGGGCDGACGACLGVEHPHEHEGGALEDEDEEVGRGARPLQEGCRVAEHA